jgi:broad specificity phosphatase PhoE
MKKLILTFTFFSLTLISYSQEVTIYYFIRHAEKLRIDKTDKNPNLNYNGYKRAEAWKDVFSNISFDAVYSTDYNRTKLTAKPTADSNNLPILLYNSNSMYSEAFKNNTKGKTVLVVGHSNTTNVFVNKILGVEKYEEINDNNNSNLYIVTITDGKSSSVLLKIN